MYNKILFFVFFIGISTGVCAQAPLMVEFANQSVRSTAITQKFLSPMRIVWKSDKTGNKVVNAESILNPGIGQAYLNKGKYMSLINGKESKSGLILDFGCEIHGGLEIVTTISNSNPAGRIRVRFGESVAETMSDIAVNGATNDHAMRDFVLTLPWLGRLEVGDTGFRFVRIDLVDPDSKIEIKEINSIFKYRDIPYLGSFTCNDERLNRIWMTGAYTVHLNMQNYLWDGIKRDRLVWVGDLHPEVMTINTVFGYQEVVPKSLDLVRDLTPLPNWMNGISSYSMWWVLIHRDWHIYHGDFGYLKEQQGYLTALLKHLATKIDANGKEILDGHRFLDWPSSENSGAVHAGLQSMMVMAFEAGSELLSTLGDKGSAAFCREKAVELRKHIPAFNDSKQAAALLALAELVPAEKSNIELLSQGGAHQMSTFYGYYMLNARARANDYQGAIDNIREYWGGMLDLGATTFWEDFNIEWKENASRIDEIVPEGMIDVHGTYGDYCYKSYRHSLCHGWASGPTPWLTRYVLGVNVLEPGCKKVKIEPHLGDLDWVEGTFPTPQGIIEIKHTKKADGKIATSVKAPKGVKIIR